MAITGSSATRLLALAALLIVAGCPPESSLPAVSTAGSAPAVARVQISPSTVLTAPGSAVLVVAKAYGSTGQVIDIGLHGCLRLEWFASQAGVLSGATSSTVQVAATTAGSLRVWAEVGRRESNDCPSDQAPGPIVSDEATIHVTSAANTPPNDQVHVEKLAAADPVALLIQGESGGTGIVDWAVAAVGVADLQKNVRARTADGISEMIAFGRGRNVLARGPLGTTAAWTTGQDIIDADPLPDPDLGLRLLPIMAGLPSDGSLTAAWAEDQIDAAWELLDRNRVGIGIDYLGSFLHDKNDPTTGLPIGVTAPVAACGTTSVNAILGAQPDVNGGAAVLYVLFVPEIVANNQAQRGWACAPGADWSGRVVFVSALKYTVTTVAHEIVHVLSLRAPHIDRLGEHTTDLKGFDEKNLMWGTSSLAEASVRDHVSLGQAYRMNFHPASWLNAEILKGAAPGQLMTRACTEKVESGICPALAADLGG